MHWQRALEWLIQHETQNGELVARRRAGLLLARLAGCQRHVAQRCTTASLCAGTYPQGLATRTGWRWNDVGKRRAQAFFCGENRIGFSGPYPPLALASGAVEGLQPNSLVNVKAQANRMDYQRQPAYKNKIRLRVSRSRSSTSSCCVLGWGLLFSEKCKWQKIWEYMMWKVAALLKCRPCLCDLT